ncbi:nuclear transport factor 2 family protein [Hyphobacterium sp. CCMP332]|nr:nuclear transport factor 2 family protein [Hyphobacterium sp. CCMP332]
MKTVFAIMLTVVLFASCQKQNQVNIELERDKILQLHKSQRDNHFNKDSISFVNNLSENFISVNNGKITQPKKKEMISKYHNYFSSVEFVKWDDVTDPIIRFSEDGKLAYSIVDKIVKVRYEDENGDLVDDETHYAWTAIYKKYDNEWKIDCVTSTEQPLI